MHMRRKALDRIDEWYRSGRRSALMVRGARQIGKTYAVMDYCSENGIHVLRIDLSRDEKSRTAFDGDLTVDSIILKLSSIHMSFRFIPGKTLIFLDEIQECPDARTALKSFAEDGRYRVIASGSLLGLKMNKVRLPSTGYVEFLDMVPMDFEEFLWAIGVPEAVIRALKDSISECKPIDDTLFNTVSEYHRWYIIVGGMPEAVQSFMEDMQFGPVRMIQDKIVEGYKADIRKHIEGDSLRSTVEACFDAVPQMLAAENKRFAFNDVGGRDPDKGYYDGYSRYAPALDWLMMANTILTCRKVSEMHMPLIERIRGSMLKIYMLDTGLLMSLYPSELISEVVRGNTNVNFGALAENVIAQALVAQRRKLYYYHDSKKRIEIDFVTVVDGSVCAVEVKSGSNRTCSSLNKAVLDMGLKGMMFETRNCFIDDKGIKHYPLFAASFLDSIDHFRMPKPDFSSIDRLKAEYGGRRSALLRRARLRKGVFISHLTTHSR